MLLNENVNKTVPPLNINDKDMYIVETEEQRETLEELDLTYNKFNSIMTAAETDNRELTDAEENEVDELIKKTRDLLMKYSEIC